MGRRKLPEPLDGKKFVLSKNTKELADKIKEYGGQIYTTVRGQKTYVVCTQEEYNELMKAPSKNTLLGRAYEQGKGFLNPISFDSLTHNSTSWNPIEFIQSVPAERIQAKSVSLVPDTIPISHKDGLEDKACNPEQFAWSNILEPTQPTETHVKEEAFWISGSTEQGINIILQELQYLRTSFKSQAEQLSRLEAENKSYMEALNNIEQVSCDSGCRYL
jgi:hypothetical protein